MVYFCVVKIHMSYVIQPSTRQTTLKEDEALAKLLRFGKKGGNYFSKRIKKDITGIIEDQKLESHIQDLSPCKILVEHRKSNDGTDYVNVTCDKDQPNKKLHKDLQCMNIVYKHPKLKEYIGVGCELRFIHKHSNKIYFDEVLE